MGTAADSWSMGMLESRLIQGVEVPALGFGTYRLQGAECSKAVELALNSGYRHIDTAQMYENESAIGKALRASAVPRNGIWITSKIDVMNMRYPLVLNSTEQSLRRLGVEQIDLMLIHWPSQTVPLGETLGALARLREDGKIRHAGVSNFSPELLREALGEGVPLFAIQVEYHPFLAQDELLGWCEQHDLLFTAYCPLARGRVARDPTLEEIARRHAKSAAQISLRWLLQKPRVAAIPKASSPEHIYANMLIFDFELSDDEMHAIDALSRGETHASTLFAPVW